MKILIEIPNTEYALVMAGENAGAIAQLLSGTMFVKSRGWGKDRKWHQVEDESLALKLCAENEFDFSKLSERERLLEKEKSNAESVRWQEYTKREAAEKRVKELEEQLALVKGMTVCETITPAQEAPPVEPPKSDDELMF